MNKPVLLFSLVLLSAPACQAELGRLFYTPEQRQGLENARTQNQTGVVSSSRIPPKPLTYDGVVLRSDGRSTRWLNGKPQSGGGYSITTRGKRLKPGQTIEGNQVYEAHGIRRVEADTQP